MALHSIGGFRIVRPLPVHNTVSRLFLADHDAAAGGRGGDEAANSAASKAPEFVVKCLMPGEGEAHEIITAQFEHEAQLMKAFSHPCIPTLHAHGSQDGVRFIVMDYIDGVDLAQLLGHRDDETRGLSKELAVYMIGQLADAIRHLHTFEASDDEGYLQSLPVLHRDINPSNIFLSRHGDVVLGDFGSAVSDWLAPEHAPKGAGTRAYMAPERIAGTGEATVQTDLFAMAVCLWEMLKGQRLFGEHDDLKVMDAIVRFDISHSSRRVSGLSPKLSEVLRRNLDRDPERRYPSAYKVLQRLAQSPEAAAAEQSRQELAALVNEAADEMWRNQNAQS